jgi:nucleotide-binding universal stress UspA family protein
MSDIRHVLVHADASAHCPARLAAAHHLGEQFDARVTACHAVMPAALQYPLGFSAGADVAPLMVAFDQERRERARSHFERAVADGAARLHWLPLDGEPVRATVQAALYADLLVLGQHDPDDTSHDVGADFVPSVLIASGTPALVLPYIGLPPAIGRVALVAWKESREAARALTAALPLLQAADAVHVALWSDDEADADDEAPRIARRLQDHRIAARVHRLGRSSSADVGEALLSLAAELGADLLVMGCYGHGRAREWVLGGASRSVLRSMTLPVLMAH